MLLFFFNFFFLDIFVSLSYDWLQVYMFWLWFIPQSSYHNLCSLLNFEQYIRLIPLCMVSLIRHGQESLIFSGISSLQNTVRAILLLYFYIVEKCDFWVSPLRFSLFVFYDVRLVRSVLQGVGSSTAEEFRSKFDVNDCELDVQAKESEEDENGDFDMDDFNGEEFGFEVEDDNEDNEDDAINEFNNCKSSKTVSTDDLARSRSILQKRRRKRKLHRVRKGWQMQVHFLLNSNYFFPIQFPQ